MNPSMNPSYLHITNEVERGNIVHLVPRVCPLDFPEKLRPYWKGHLEYSLTPCQSGWIYLNECGKKIKRNANFSNNSAGAPDVP